MEEAPIRVLIVDDIAETRSNIRKIMESAEDIEVVGEARTGIEAIKKYHELRPDVVSMNINMPEMDGITATKTIIELHNDANIFILSVQSEADYMRRAKDAGAKYFLAKPPSKEELITTVRWIAGRLTEGEMHPATVEKEMKFDLRFKWESLGANLLELDMVAKKFFKGNLTLWRTNKGWKVWLGPPTEKNLSLALDTSK